MYKRFGCIDGLLCTVGAVALLGVTSSTNADLIDPGTYRLHNHPDGSQADPLYGLRLDELFDVTEDRDIFTFDFDHPDAEMLLDYDDVDGTIRIHGLAFGGLDVGDFYSGDPEMTSMVRIDFFYGAVSLVDADNDLIVTTPTGTNSGSITWLDSGEVIGLVDKANNEGFTFRFGDEGDNFGHRDFTGLSGWGWLNHGDPATHVNSSDWLFTAEIVPAPPVLALFGVTLMARRRRTG